MISIANVMITTTVTMKTITFMMITIKLSVKAISYTIICHISYIDTPQPICISTISPRMITRAFPKITIH